MAVALVERHFSHKDSSESAQMDPQLMNVRPLFLSYLLFL